MAVLKKGSKGKDVEKLQELLNKFGIKPPLKVDGIFGPVTEKALRAAQGKLKLEKVDGMAGDYTMAALKYGKPLPQMTVRDLSQDAPQHKMIRQHNERMQASYGIITKEATNLAKVLSQYNKSIQGAIDALEAPRAQAAAVADSLAKVQADYHKNLLTNPAAAEKCAKAVESGYPAYEKLTDQIEKAMMGVIAACGDFKTNLSTATSAIDGELNAMKKRVETARKAQQQLTRT